MTWCIFQLERSMWEDKYLARYLSKITPASQIDYYSWTSDLDEVFLFSSKEDAQFASDKIKSKYELPSYIGVYEDILTEFIMLD